MSDRFPIKKLLPLTPENTPSVQQRFQSSPQHTAPAADTPPQPVPVGTAQRRELPATLLQLEPKPLSAYDDNPVFDEIGAAHFIGVTANCLKKWRQRKQGPDYLQYGKNGPVRYELKALMDFRDKHRVRPRRRN